MSQSVDMVTPPSKKWSKKDDHLWLLRLLAVDFFQNSLMRLIPKIFSASLVLLMMFQTVLFLQRFNAMYFIKYLAFYGGSFFLVAAFYTVPKASDICQEIVNGNFLVWTIQSASLATKRRILFETLLTQLAVIFNEIVAIVSGVTHMLPPLQDDDDLFFPLALFEDFFPQWESFLSWGFRVCFIPVSFILPATFYMFLYLMTFLRFQVYLLIDFLETIDEKYNPKQDKQYQEMIQRKLEIGISRHVYLYRTVSVFQIKCSLLIFIFYVAGAILGISIFVFYFSFQGTFEGRYPRIITLVLAAIVTFFLTIFSGQMLVNVSNELWEVSNRTNWYNWNQKNKKSYLIFLINQKTLKLKFSDTMTVNYNLGVAIVKSIYSMVSVMSRLKHLNYSQ